MNKKLLSLFLVLTMLASMLSFISVFAADDVIYSNSFEKELEGWTYYGNESTSVSTAKAKDGKSSLYVNDVSDSDSGGFNGNLIKCIPGETYTATIQVYNEVDGAVFMLRFLASDKKTTVKDSPRAKPTKKGEWETLTTSLKAPEGAEYVRVMVVTFLATKGVAYYDDVKLMGKAGETVKPSTPPASSEPSNTGSTETSEPEVNVEATGSKYQTEIEFLATLGLIDDAFKYNAEITKAEVAKMISKALHPEVDFSVAGTDEPAFNDVPASHAFYPYIKACKDLGVVNGDFENNFNPDAHITAIEAMTLVINALGYTPYAQALGGYPTGFYSIASQTGISKGLNIASTDAILGETAAKIIYNALFASLVEMNSIKNDSIQISINNGKNILSERLGIYEYDAIVEDNGITSILDSSINDPEKAVIREVKTGKRITAFVNGTDIAKYLGYKVKAFIRNNMESGRYDFVFVAPANNKVVTVNAKYIFNPNNSYVEYDEDETTSTSEKINFGSVKPRIIYNGVRAEAYVTVAESIPQDGFVTFIENTGDSYFDIINVISFNENNTEPAWNIIVDTVDTTKGEQSISCMFSPVNSIDLNDDNYSYNFAMNDEIKAITDLKQGDVVSVAKAPGFIDGKTHYILVPSRNKIDGTLSGIGDNSFLLDNGNEYKISSGALDVKPNYVRYFNMGKKITLWIDAVGNVAYAEGENGASKNYAYLVKTAIVKVAGSDTAVVKVFTKDGKMENYTLSTKCRIDGRQFSTPAIQLEAVNKRTAEMINSRVANDDRVMGRPVIIELNSEGLVTKIDTDNPNILLGYTGGDSVAADNVNVDLVPGILSEFYATQQPIQYSQEDVDSFETLNAGFRNPGASAFYDNNMKSIEGKFFITANTFIINAAEIDTHGYKADVYKQYSVAQHSSDKYHKHPNNSLAILKTLEGDDEDYSITNGSKVARQICYDIQGYDIDPDTGVAAFAVIRGKSQAEIATSAEMCIYSRRTQVYDANKEKTVSKLYYYDKAGKEASVLYDPEILLASYVTLVDSTIKTGDVLRFIKNAEGYITSIDRVISIDRLISKDQLTSLSVDTNGATDINTTYYIGYSNNTITTGYANSVKGGYADIIGGSHGAKLSNFFGSSGAVNANNKYFMDFSKLKPIVVTVTATGIDVKEGTFDDIITVKDVTDAQGNVNINKASILVFRQSRFVPNYLIVFNGLETRTGV